MRIKNKILSALVLTGLMVSPSYAGLPSDKDVQIVLRSLGFFDPAFSGDIEAVVAFDNASKDDAEKIASLLTASSPKVNLKAKAMSVEQVAGSSAKVVFVPDSLKDYKGIEAATKAGKITLETGNGCTDADKCVISIKAEPKVSIIVAPNALSASGLKLNPSFKMMIVEKK